MRNQKPFVAYTYTVENPSAKRRRLIRFWTLLFLIVIFFLSIGSYALWRLAPAPKWRTLVVDKTVPYPDYREHQALFWVLNHTKVTNKGGKRRWRSGKDYVGFYPEKFIASDASFSSNLEPDHTIGVNLLFVVDTYGVYVDDYKSPEDYGTHLDYSKKIFGGLAEKEVEIIEDFVQNGGSLVTEFNTFDQPTPQGTRERMEQLLGLRSTGWIGRFFADLSNKYDVPAWALRNWKTLHGEEWDFTGPGFIIAHPDNRLLVLEEGKDVESRGLLIEINLPDDPVLKAVSPRVPYPYWFDIVLPAEGTEVLAHYRLHLTQNGREKMQKYSLPETFPAVLRASRSPLRIYFAGDFSDSPIYRGPYFFSGWSQIRRILCFVGKNRAQNKFYWSFYVPLLSNIFRNYGTRYRFQN